MSLRARSASPPCALATVRGYIPRYGLSTKLGCEQRKDIHSGTHRPGETEIISGRILRRSARQRDRESTHQWQTGLAIREPSSYSRSLSSTPLSVLRSIGATPRARSRWSRKRQNVSTAIRENAILDQSTEIQHRSSPVQRLARGSCRVASQLLSLFQHLNILRTVPPYTCSGLPGSEVRSPRLT